MTERQIELLKKALELYEFTINQRRQDSKSDVEEANEFFHMTEALSEILGFELN